MSRENAVLFQAGMSPCVSREEGVSILALTAEGLKELCNMLKPYTGVYSLNKTPLTVELVPTKIKDSDGNVIKVIQ